MGWCPVPCHDGSDEDVVKLRSQRLWLRPLRPEDALSILGYRSLPEVARFQEWEAFGPDDAARLIAAQAGIRPDTPGTWLQLALVLLESGEIIGDCGVHFRRDEPRQVELGITFPRPTRARAGHGSLARCTGVRVRFSGEAPRVGSDGRRE